MRCPVCDKALAPTLSICPSCGAMMNDTVREELETKIARSLPSKSIEISMDLSPPRPIKIEIEPSPQPVRKRVDTGPLNSPKTSPTLVEFQNASAPIPEWRLQMQNAVRQRIGTMGDETGSDKFATISSVMSTSQPAGVPGAEAALTTPKLENADPRLDAALKRLADSRRVFSTGEVVGAAAAAAARALPAKSFPFNIVQPSVSVPVRNTKPAVPNDLRPRATKIAPLPSEKKLDTNKLPLIQTVVVEKAEKVEIATFIEAEVIPVPAESKKPTLIVDETEFSEFDRILINADKLDEELADNVDVDEDDIEDLAPFSMRFNAGFFDLIIGVFATMILMSPFALLGGDWFTATGLAIFAVCCGLVLFVYMTLCVGFVGKTLGMQLFSLELVDAEQNQYPTLNQAAVSNSLYLLSLATFGLGFITIFFDEENRAFHDLISGTIIVRDF